MVATFIFQTEIQARPEYNLERFYDASVGRTVRPIYAYTFRLCANVRGVLLCIKGGVTPRIYSRFLHVGISPHPAFYRSPLQLQLQLMTVRYYTAES